MSAVIQTSDGTKQPIATSQPRRKRALRGLVGDQPVEADEPDRPPAARTRTGGSDRHRSDAAARGTRPRASGVGSGRHRGMMAATVGDGTRQRGPQRSASGRGSAPAGRPSGARARRRRGGPPASTLGDRRAPALRRPRWIDEAERGRAGDWPGSASEAVGRRRLGARVPEMVGQAWRAARTRRAAAAPWRMQAGTPEAAQGGAGHDDAGGDARPGRRRWRRPGRGGRAGTAGTSRPAGDAHLGRARRAAPSCRARSASTRGDERLVVERQGGVVAVAADRGPQPRPCRRRPGGATCRRPRARGDRAALDPRDEEAAAVELAVDRRRGARRG